MVIETEIFTKYHNITSDCVKTGRILPKKKIIYISFNFWLFIVMALSLFVDFAGVFNS